MKILLVYPKYPVTYWGFQHALKFVSKKASFPPLGLLTIAALIPECHEKRLVDMNVTKLHDKDLMWADYVFVSAMVIQKESACNVIERCRGLGIKIAAGGPLFSAEPEQFTIIDHLFINETEDTLLQFFEDLAQDIPKRIYKSEQWVDISKSPLPQWNLIKHSDYATMNIQYSRGCPFNCEFCNIASLFGRVPRTKSAEQLTLELDELYATGWRGGVFFVDDNFIGNTHKLKQEILPAMILWMKDKNHPFSFLTEVSINIADDDDLMVQMTRAGFDTVFIGIETPNQDSLIECNKMQNKNRDLITSIKKVQGYGLQVHGGFIVGFDNDGANIFDNLINFIQQSGIAAAMVGLLNAPKGTRLYLRMAKEGRLNDVFSGDNTDFSMNFVPKMDQSLLVNGYNRIVETIYSPKRYYERVLSFLKEYKPANSPAMPRDFAHFKAFFKAVVRLGIFGRERRYYWKLVIWSTFKRPDLLPLAVTLSIYGFHFRKVFSKTMVKA